MSDMVRRLAAASAAFFAGLICMSTPIIAYAESIDDYDFAEEILQNYKSQGLDGDGNVVLSQEDYELYMNDVLAYIEKNSADVSDSETLTKSQTRALKSSAVVKSSASTSSGSDLILDEVKEKSRFLDLPVFNNFVLDAVKWMITECLSNPIHAGEVLPEDSETESEVETETEPAPPTATTDTVPAIAGLGSNLQKYTINGNDLYERIDVTLKAKIATTKDDSDVRAVVTRSGLGATSSYELTYDASVNTRNITIAWNSSNYPSAIYGFPAGTLYAGYQLSVYRVDYEENDYDRYSGFTPKIYNFSVNQLPVISRSGSTVVNLSSIINGSNAIFAENSFYSNHPTYISNHTINSTTNNYWNSYNVSTTNTNSYITSNTTINTTNYNDYSQYGYYVDNSGGLAIDEATLNAYIQNALLAGILQGYIDFYSRFPEVGVNVTDPDIQYVDPFDDGQEDPTEPSTPSIVIDYNEILSEDELESILNQETYDIPELDTSFARETFFIDYEGIQPETTAPPAAEIRKRSNLKASNPAAQEAQMYNQLRSDIQTKGGDLVDDVQANITDFVYNWFLGGSVDSGDGSVPVNPISNAIIEYNPIYRVVMCTAIFSAIYKALKR